MTSPLLSFDGVSRRLETIRWDLLDEDLNLVGHVHPEGTPGLAVNRAQPIRRSIDNINLVGADATRLTMRTRLRPMWVFEDGWEEPLGVFSLTDETAAPDYTGRLEAVAMGDQMSLYRENLEHSYSVRPGDVMLDRLLELHRKATFSVPFVDADPLTAVAQSPLAWPSGTPILQAMSDIAKAMAARVWFDRRGTLRVTAAAPDDEDVPSVDLREPISGSVKFSYSNEDTPNRWVARDDDQDYSIIGEYELPDDAPHSVARRGRKVTRFVTIDGLTDPNAARLAAMAASLEETFPYKEMTAKFPGRPDLEEMTRVRVIGDQVFSIDTISTELIPNGTTEVRAQAVWVNPDTRNLEPRLRFDGNDPLPWVGQPEAPSSSTMGGPKFGWQRDRSGLPSSARAGRHERDARRAARDATLERGYRSAAAERLTTTRKGRVTSVDRELGLASVVLDEDPEGNEVVVPLESEIPGVDQRVRVQFNGARPSLVRNELGVQRLLGRATVSTSHNYGNVSAAQDLSGEGFQVEANISQPARLIRIGIRFRVSARSPSTYADANGICYREDPEGNVFAVGTFYTARIQDGEGTHINNDVYDVVPDPGIYRYYLTFQAENYTDVHGFQLRCGSEPGWLAAFDAGADPGNDA